MADKQLERPRMTVRPLPPNLRSVQPGGGHCYRIELAWGRLRRWYLKRFRSGYVRRMAELRIGDTAGAPHEILDPRDLKFVRNQCTADWKPADDPFRWRDAIPFARWGLAELQLMGYPLLALTIALTLTPWWYLALVPGVVLLLIVYFFRDPPRPVPTEPNVLVAPCDGTIAEITRLPNDPFIGGPAIRVGIFLSIFNVHINRWPTRARAIEFRYSPGEFLNAINPESLIRNENLWIGLEEEDSPHRRMVVRQIAGLIARRIVCQLRPGELADRGAKFGMIKLGSRTELIFLDEPGVDVPVQVGQKVLGASTIVARFSSRHSGVEGQASVETGSIDENDSPAVPLG